jgi:hypothetical protein
MSCEQLNHSRRESLGEKNIRRNCILVREQMSGSYDSADMCLQLRRQQLQCERNCLRLTHDVTVTYRLP